MNHVYTTTKATILFVEVPEDARDIEVYFLREYNPVFWRMQWKCNNLSPFNHTDIGRGGTWQFITLLKDAREETAMTLVDESTMKEAGKQIRITYRDYNEPLLQIGEKLVMNGIFFEALPSLHSLANSLGVKGNTAILIKNK
jgi:hypothetical protein